MSRLVRTRTLAWLCAASTAIGCTCFAFAIARYPGGTWFDRHAVGHSFWRNFLCDLMQRDALNGTAAGMGSTLARAGAVAMFAAIGSFFVLVARIAPAPDGVLARITRTAGVLAATSGLAVPFVESDVRHNLHMIVVLTAFVPALVGAITAAWISLRIRDGSLALRAFAIVTLAAGAFDGIAYACAYAIAFGLAIPLQRQWLYASLPAFQRVAALALVGWIAAVVHRARTVPEC